MTLGIAPANEKELENELRRRIKGLMTPKLNEDESLFRRFLTARNHDINAAETMLKNHINWRKVNKVDTILSDYRYPQLSDTYFGQTRIGFDKEGSRVVYIDIGNMDNRGLFKTFKKQELIRYVIYTTEDDIEQIKIQSAKSGKQQDQMTFIFNLDNFSMSNATNKTVIDFITTLVKLHDLNYPERMKISFIINASPVYTVVWTALKPFLSDRTIQKVKVFGKEGWQEELLEIIDADVLPGFLGGNRTDPDGDPMCRSFVNHGLLVPEKYYVDKKSTSISEKRNAKKISLPRKSKAEVKLQVIHPGSRIQWEFEIKSKDVGFSLLYKESENKDVATTELIPFRRIETDLSPESNVFQCDKRGFYILVFDNTYSWLHHKEIYCIASVVEPNNSLSVVEHL